jgi:hypothetical protein
LNGLWREVAVPRSRNIKPGFFKSEELAQCEPLARLLFAALWCEADREGLLLDRPLRLKAEYLPYDSCDCNQLLDQLASFGLIVRYEVNGVKYISIPKFGSHQNPHPDEKAKGYPAPQQAVATWPTSGQQVADQRPTTCQPAASQVVAQLIPDSLVITKPADKQRSVGKSDSSPSAGLEVSEPERTWHEAERLAKRLGVPMRDFDYGHRVAALVVAGKLSDRFVAECAAEAKSQANGNPMGLFRTKLRAAGKQAKLRIDELAKSVRFPPTYYRGPPEPVPEIAQLAQALSRTEDA